MSDDYIAFCEEKLWCAWKQHTLSMPSRFDLEAAPEPYLYFGTSSNKLVALTTNPGGTMRHQRHAAVRSGRGPLRDKDTYAEAALKLGCFYEKILEGRPAGHRIANLRKLSSLLGYGGVMQVELIPFHSAALPRKDALLGQINEKDSLLGRYVGLLREFLKNRAVVSIQAVSTRASLSQKTELSHWLRWVAKIAGVDPETARFVSLVEKGPKTTCAAWVSKRKPRKAFVLMMGKNDLPADVGPDDKGLRKLATALRDC